MAIDEAVGLISLATSLGVIVTPIRLQPPSLSKSERSCFKAFSIQPRQHFQHTTIQQSNSRHPSTPNARFHHLITTPNFPLPRPSSTAQHSTTQPISIPTKKTKPQHHMKIPSKPRIPSENFQDFSLSHPSLTHLLGHVSVRHFFSCASSRFRYTHHHSQRRSWIRQAPCVVGRLAARAVLRYAVITSRQNISTLIHPSLHSIHPPTNSQHSLRVEQRWW